MVQTQSRVSHAPVPAVTSNLPRLRRTFTHFSEHGVMARGGGVVSGKLKIQLRKGFTNKTKVLVAYEDHKVFVEVEGSPLEGDVKPRDILVRLRSTGMTGIAHLSHSVSS